jgi:histone deacetylase 1/2
MEAIQSELDSLIENNTWIEVSSLPTSRKPIDTRWIFKIKRDATGNIERYKARLVARGFTQIPGIDFDETFSPVTRLTTIRMLIAIRAKKGYSLRQCDTKTAFLNASLQEEIYIDIPKMYVPKAKDTKFLLKKGYLWS